MPNNVHITTWLLTIWEPYRMHAQLRRFTIEPLPNIDFNSKDQQFLENKLRNIFKLFLLLGSGSLQVRMKGIWFRNTLHSPSLLHWVVGLRLMELEEGCMV